MGISIFLYLSFFILFYSYFGYALIALLLLAFKKGKTISRINDIELKSVTLVIAAFNEEAFIEQKIKNSLSLTYDKNKLSIYIVTDGSTDLTASIVKKYPQVVHFHQNIREGKIAAVNRIMNFVNTEIVVFTDANTLLNENSLIEIVKHYADPKVGGVAGEKRILINNNDKQEVKGEGLYWQYESILKKIDSDFYSVVGAAGELFSIRTNLYQHPGNNVLLDDFIISLNVCLKGYKIAYEPDAFAFEKPSYSIQDEQKRKIRISAGGFQSMVMLKELFKFWKYPKLSFLYISHRVLRWTICPLLLPLLFVFNIIQLSIDFDYILLVSMIAQLLLYFFALVCYLILK